MALSKLIRRWGAVAAALALVVGVSACAESQREPGGDSGGAGDGGTFIFAGSSNPATLDPAMASDGESFRIARNMFEGLVSLKPGTIELEPLLATQWSSSEDGLSHSFVLREGVKFHDGTDFNAEAVCANFDRWYNWEGLNQSENISYYYGKIFRGYKTGPKSKDALYKSCDAADPQNVTINLNSPFASFVQAMTLPAFSMASPEALEKYQADNTQGTEDDPRFSEYATAHPTGTGPFTFESWERDQQVTLKRNDDYWGDKAKVDTAIIRIIADAKARTQELQAGNIHGYDLVAPADVAPLKEAGFQIKNRPAFNVLYLGFNQKNKALQDPKVREALAYAVDKEGVVKQSLPEGSKIATQFVPEMVNGYNSEVTVREHDVAKAKQLLKEAGQEDLELKFAYPTGVSRPYMPTPEDTYVSIKAQLEEAGIKVTPVAAQWTDYLDLIQGDNGQDKRDIHLLGWTGDYNDPDNFLGVFFGGQSSEWGFDNPELFKALSDARALPTTEEQKVAYEKINADIANYVPGVPIAHPAPSLAFAEGVQGYEPSPVQDEVWNHVTVS